MPDKPSTHQQVKAVEGAGGVVFNRQGEVLLLKHKKDEWVFPKGHLEQGETHLEAALREVEEEAGVSAHCPNPDFRYVTEYKNNKGTPRRISWFLLRTDAKKLILREATFPDGNFYRYDKAKAKLSFKEDRALLKDMFKHLDKVSEHKGS